MDPKSRSEGLRRERAAASPQFERATRRFRNPGGAGPQIEGGHLPLVGRYVFGKEERRPKQPLRVEDPRAAWRLPPETGFRVTWLGHSTVLLEMDGVTILTDPVFANRISPFPPWGLLRFHPVPAELAALPDLDLIVLSHDHYDHLCKHTMTQLAKREVRFATALGVGRYLESYGIAQHRIHELDWHESIEIQGRRGAVKVTATPAQHFSGRLGSRGNETLWASWVIATERRRVFFSGDTGLFDGFADIGKLHGPFDLTMLEVGAFDPAWNKIHLGPENGLKAHALLSGDGERGLLLPVHWSTFNLGFHGWDAPGEELYALAQHTRTPLLLPRLGRTIEPTRECPSSAWWREV
jgi:L-ascorbate metabolism protein UlaG (beta-lactamase superfamily)